jgi:hypothetical protein
VDKCPRCGSSNTGPDFNVDADLHADTVAERHDAAQCDKNAPTPRRWYCTNADDYRIPACSKQCEKCFRADMQDAIEAAEFNKNMERECKP